ncbi:MAG: hypothetical protein RLZZ630_1036 [Bacteroidota bacterium]
MKPGQNPFPLHATSREAQFIDRSAAIQALNESLKTGKTVLVSGRKGAGKSTLIRQWEIGMENSKGAGILIADCYPSLTEEEWLRSITRQLLSGIDPSQVKTIRELASSLTFMHPLVRYESFSGKAVLDFTLDSDYKPALCLEQLFTYISRTLNPKAIVLDGLQQLGTFRGSDTLSHLKQAITGSPKTQFVFCADEGLQLKQIRERNQMPVDVSILVDVVLDQCGEEILSTYFEKGFSNEKRKLSREAIEHLMDWCRMDLSATVQLAHRLFSGGQKLIDEWTLQEVLREMQQEREAFYYTYRDLLTDNQWILLRGIARERGAKMVMGSEFIRKNGLGTPSSVQTAMAALQEKSLIYEEEGKWWVCDVIFSRWLEEAG